MQKKKINSGEVKEQLLAYFQNDLPEFIQHPEFKAALTHFILNPDIRPPFMDRLTHGWLRNFFYRDSQAIGKVVSAKEDQSPWQKALPFIVEELPYKPPPDPEFTFIDLFAGIGGFRIALQKVGGKCVFSCEWDKYAKKTYEENFGECPYGDVKQFTDPKKIDDDDLKRLIPDHDVLVAGFPCQPFSIAGVSKKKSLGREHGFKDPTQGTLFFDIKRILDVKRPAAFFLENVKNLLTHDEKRTFEIIMKTLKKDLGYVTNYEIVDGKKWVPQHRERVFIVGYNPRKVKGVLDKNIIIPVAPKGRYRYPRLKDIIEDEVDEKYTLGPGTWATLERHKAHHKSVGNGFGYGLITKKMLDTADTVTRTMSARYHKDGAEILIEQNKNRPRRLTVKEAMQLMGFNPKKFKFHVVSDTQAYRQIGNSVVVPAVKETAKEIAKILKKHLPK